MRWAALAGLPRVLAKSDADPVSGPPGSIKQNCEVTIKEGMLKNPANVLEVIGRWLLGIAEWFELIVEKLYYFGEYLIGLAKQGYGGEFSFPKDD